MVRKNLEHREHNNTIRKDLFQLFIQIRNKGKIQDEGDWSIKSTIQENALSVEEIAAHAFVYFTTGYEAIASAMTFFMYEVAKYPEIQRKAYENIQHALRQHDSKLTYDSLAEMRYLDDCIDGK